MKKNVKTKRDLLLETNRRLQETTQELFMAKQELEKKNKELEDARERERLQKEKLEQFEHVAMKHLANPRIEEGPEPALEKKLTKSIAEDLSLKYIQLLRNYLQTKKLDKEEPLIEGLGQLLIEYGVTPKGIIDLHLKAAPKVETIDGLETKRISVEIRMVLLAVMTKYADLLRKKGG